MNTWGERFRISIFGESHGEAIGVVVDGIPSGTPLDLEEIAREIGVDSLGYLSVERVRKIDRIQFLHRAPRRTRSRFSPAFGTEKRPERPWRV